MTIGSHSSCDLRIDEKGGGANSLPDLLEQGQLGSDRSGRFPGRTERSEVQKAVLKSGDTLRFGTVDVKFHGGLTLKIHLRIRSDSSRLPKKRFSAPKPDPTNPAKLPPPKAPSPMKT